MTPARASAVRLRRPPRMGGWTLVELAVVLTIAAVLAVVLLRTLGNSRQVVDDQPPAAQLALAQESLLGYAQAQARLPAADHDGDGREDAGADSGWLPVRTLSLPARLRLRYRVATGLSAAPGNLYQPAWPDTTAAEAGSAHAGNLAAVAQVNGLDLCARLAASARAPVAMAGLGMPAAFALTAVGPPGHAQDAAAAATLPGSQAAASSAYLTLATGLGELAARLACPDRVARLQGAVREAAMGADMIRLAQVHLDFRKLAEEQAELTKLNAGTSVAFGGFDVAYAGAEIALASSELAGDGGVLAAVELAVSIAELANGTAALVLAGIDLDDAIKGVAKADTDTANAEANLERMQALAQRTRQRVLDLDAAGLDP